MTEEATASYVPPAKPPDDEDGWRICRASDCDKRFKPWSPTAFHCSAECALAELRRRHGLPGPARTQASPTARREERREHPEIIDRERGPMRDVAERLGPAKAASHERVRLTCGHETTAKRGSKRGRCRACKKGEPT